MASTRPRAGPGTRRRRGLCEGSIKSFIFPFDSLTSKFHAAVFIRHRFVSLAISLLLYAAVMFLTAGALGVSSNYFVIVAIIAAALGFGTRGGFVAGLAALPANLLIFALLGHPEFSPASKPIAELSGLLVGLAFGRLADYFRDVEREIKKRMATEEALRAALGEKELLLRELSHRVKNNLNVMKSLVQLQRNRSRDPAFLEAADELIGRIFAISLVHDQLHQDQEVSTVDPARYLEALVANIVLGLGLGEGSISLRFGTEGRLMPVESAVSLGLIVNEVLTNAVKHGSKGSEGQPSIRLSLESEGELYSLEICDDGPGPIAAPEDVGGGLGLKLVRALARSLGGTASLSPIDGVDGAVGARFELSFPG
jgi:two-component sensor histidine kinase